MIYIINESVMNGTVTMSISSYGIEAENWDEAVEKFKLKVKDNAGLKITRQDNETVDYEVEQEKSLFSVWGSMKNQSLTIW